MSGYRSIGKSATSYQKPSLITDPKILGPGVWFSLHKMAFAATTIPQMESFIAFAQMIISEFPCQKCRDHGLKYLKDHPIEEFVPLVNSTGRPIGMFRWTWMFHNEANRGLGKPGIPFDQAFMLYADPASGAGCPTCVTPRKSTPGSTKRHIPSVQFKKR